jgi:hypothetical protein
MPVSLTRLRICCGMHLSLFTEIYVTLTTLCSAMSLSQRVFDLIYSRRAWSSTFGAWFILEISSTSLLSESTGLNFNVLHTTLTVRWSTVDQVSEHHVLCCPLIAFDVIAKDHNLPPSRTVEIMKENWLLGRKPPLTIKDHFLCRTYGFESPHLHKVGLVLEVRVWKLLLARQAPTIDLWCIRYFDGRQQS